MSEGLPRAIYIETSILRQLPVDIASPEFLQLKDLCDKLTMPIFTTKLCVDEFVENHREDVAKTISSALRASNKLSRYTEMPPQVIRPGDETRILIEVERRILENFLQQRITVLENAKVDQERLIEMSVKKLKPFTHKGEKGFRDTLILFTIVNNEIQRKQQNTPLAKGYSLILCQDDTLAEAIQQLPEGRDLGAVVIRSIPEAIKHLEGFLGSLFLGYYKARAETLRNFLIEHKDEIETFIRREAYFLDIALMGAELTLGDYIEEIESIDLLDIDKVFPGILADQTKERRVRISFSAKLRLMLVIRPSRLSQPPFRTLRVRGEEQPEAPVQRALTLGDHFGVEPLKVNKTVERLINIQASAYLKQRGLVDEYSDLLLESVM